MYKNFLPDDLVINAVGFEMDLAVGCNADTIQLCWNMPAVRKLYKTETK